ncbi:hypothetical protein ACE6H2_027104 [Prunus campanulata]
MSRLCLFFFQIFSADLSLSLSPALSHHLTLSPLPLSVTQVPLFFFPYFLTRSLSHSVSQSLSLSPALSQSLTLSLSLSLSLSSLSPISLFSLTYSDSHLPQPISTWFSLSHSRSLSAALS